MIEYPYEPRRYLSCSCCGCEVINEPGENVYLHEPEGSPYPSDDGFGMCKPCGGDPAADSSDLSDENVRKRLGYAGTIFYDARIDLLTEKLNDTNRAKFEKMAYASKVALVISAVEDGLII